MFFILSHSIKKIKRFCKFQHLSSRDIFDGSTFVCSGKCADEPTVLKAVNLGEDTDTVAAVAGSLAGALYGYDGIPQEWRDTLIKIAYIEEICLRASENWR